MAVYEIDPVGDERWDAFLEKHTDASIFHTRGWLEALRQTYDYKAVAFTTSPPGQPLTNGFPFCQISSWLSGSRLVSLPFSDHCTPLVESSDELTHLLTYLQEKRDAEKWSHIEIRPPYSMVIGDASFGKSKSFFFHKLDLSPCLDDIFQNFHRDCVRRKIQRAAREGLVYEEGRSARLLSMFYQLLLMTRRRHGLPAQPVAWFQNLIACLCERVKIRVALKNGQPVASILTICYKQALVYKYGCADQRFNNLGGTQLLFWRSIQEAKECRLREFDLGRSDCDNPGLITFKDRWGATRTELVYLRYPARYSHSVSETGQALISKYVWSHAPSCMLAAAGRAFYRHMG